MPDEAADLASTTTIDSLLGGRLQLRQPRRGHRAGTDAVLLAASVPETCSGLICDVGSGVGAAGLAIALMRPAVEVDLIEIDSDLAALAEENLALNDLAARGHVRLADITDPASRAQAGLIEGQTEVVVTNPPYFDPAQGRHSPDAGRRAAHVMRLAGAEPLQQWILACVKLMAPGGTFIMIHRPDALPAILPACKGLGEVTILPVHPRQGRPASRILLRGRKGSRAPLSLAPPLVLHAGEKFTPEADAIHRGEALLQW